jgi:hypothetical protein
LAPLLSSEVSGARTFFRKNDFVWEKKEIDSQAPKPYPVLHIKVELGQIFSEKPAG